jgi:hypothetical protein
VENEAEEGKKVRRTALGKRKEKRMLEWEWIEEYKIGFSNIGISRQA